ncbi:MAG: S46 family peptidase [Prevotella sp.]|nr:S46 family peptidase [Candidatus Prevotella equi]
MTRRLITLFVSLTFALFSHADEGMWTLYNLPDAVYKQMQAEGFTLPKSALYDDSLALKNCVVNFSGYCTGEVVSPLGLVMTNHHCGFESIRSHSTVEHDYMLNGFCADSLGAELPNEDMFVAFMRSQRDITSMLDSLGIRTMNTFDQEALIDSINQVLTSEAQKQDSTLYVEIDAFYEGNAYYATTYQRYQDIRLVFAPTKSLGKFGGETDNWMWPRQTCDFSVFRIYVDPVTGGPAPYSKDNVPMRPKTWLHISTEGYSDGDFAMVLGYPGSTERYLSSFGIEEMRNCVNDPMQQVRSVKQKVMKRHMDASEAVRIKYDSKYAQSSNYWKNAIGMNKCIDSIGIVSMKREYEERIKAQQPSCSEGDNADSVSCLSALDLDKLQGYYARRAEAMRTFTLFAETFTRRSNNELATRATKYYNGMPVQGSEKNSRKQYVSFVENNDTWDRDLDIEAMAALLDNYRAQAPSTYIPEFYKTIDKDFNGDSKAYVTHVWDNTILMRSNTKIPVRTSRRMQKDPGIKMSMDLVETLADIRLVLDELGDSIKEQERLLCAAKVRMEQDMPHYSDANFTMRMTYGQVGGYSIGDFNSGYYTDAASLVEKMKKGDSIEDYRVEPYVQQYFCNDSTATADREALSNLKLCFLTNNDITGGNSGSPVIDGKGQLIGLAFDGNWDSLSADIYFDKVLARCINVDIRYILYVMQQNEKAKRLLEEIK